MLGIGTKNRYKKGSSATEKVLKNLLILHNYWALFAATLMCEE